MAAKTKNTHRALMTLKATGKRKEIKRGTEFVPVSVQEGLDLVGLNQAALINPAPADVAAPADVVAPEGAKA